MFNTFQGDYKLANESSHDRQQQGLESHELTWRVIRVLNQVLPLLIRPCEVLSRVANVTILEVANNALRVLLQHRHVIIGSLA